MNKLIKFLYRFKILNLNNRKIDYWVDTKQLKKIAYASKNGNFKIWIKILESVKNKLDNKQIVKIVSELIDDAVQIVSEKAIDVLKGHSEFSEQISRKEEFWIETRKKTDIMTKRMKREQTWKTNKKGMVRLNQVKQQLKKSMYGEKWM